MKSISLTSIGLKNFRSYIDEVVTFPVNPGLLFLTGENLVDKLGSNGAAKSTLWDGVAFAFYGTAVKGTKTSNLLTWGKETLEVELEFKINGLSQTIYRTSPPMRIYLNGKTEKELVTQEAITTLIGLTKEQFLQSVIFGQDMRL